MIAVYDEMCIDLYLTAADSLKRRLRRRKANARRLPPG